MVYAGETLKQLREKKMQEATKEEMVLVWHNGENDDTEKLTLALSVPRDVTPEGLAQILACEEPDGIVVAIVPRTLWRVKPASGEERLHTLARSTRNQTYGGTYTNLTALPADLLEALDRRARSPWRAEIERRKAELPPVLASLMERSAVRWAGPSYADPARCADEPYVADIGDSGSERA